MAALTEVEKQVAMTAAAMESLALSAIQAQEPISHITERIGLCRAQEEATHMPTSSPLLSKSEYLRHNLRCMMCRNGPDHEVHICPSHNTMQFSSLIAMICHWDRVRLRLCGASDEVEHKHLFHTFECGIPRSAEKLGVSYDTVIQVLRDYDRFLSRRERP